MMNSEGNALYFDIFITQDCGKKDYDQMSSTVFSFTNSRCGFRTDGPSLVAKSAHRCP